MTTEQTTEFVRMVDEMRRLQQITRRPPDAVAARMLRLAEGAVDLLVMKYREPDPDTVDTTLAPSENKV